MKQNPPHDKSIPGPGAYKVVLEPGKEATKYTMRPKTTSIEGNLIKKKVRQGITRIQGQAHTTSRIPYQP